MASGKMKQPRDMIDSGHLEPTGIGSAFLSFEPRNIDLCLLSFMAL
jgi:hypothetical protein